MGFLRPFEFAALVGATRQAIYKYTRNGKFNVVDGLLDMEDPAVIAYCEQRGIVPPPGEPWPGNTPAPPSAPAAKKPKSRKKKATEKKAPASKSRKKEAEPKSKKPALKVVDGEKKGKGGRPPAMPPDIEDNPHASMRTKLENYRIQQQTLKFKLQNDEAAGRLVPRDLVINAVINPLETEQVRILSDGCQTMAALVHAACQGGASVTEVEKILRHHLSTFIRARKRTIARLLGVHIGEQADG